MINKKSIIILSAVVVVLIGAFLAVNYLWTDEEAATGISSSESIELFTTAKENIVQMDLSVGDESFSFVRSEDKWLLAGDESVKLKNSSVDYLCVELAGIYAKQCVEENAADLAKYGLSQPFGTYKISLADGTDKTFLLGNQDPVTDAYYFKMADTDAVYTIYSSKGDSLSKKSAEYKDSAILEVDSENLSRVYVRSNDEVLELKKEIIGEGEEAKILWNMLQPMKRECDVQPITDNIISKISYITVSEFINADDERYSSSGVDAPDAVIELTDDDGVSQTIYVGKSEGEQRYIKTNDRVYLISADSVSFTELDPFIYIMKFISLENIDSVSKIEVTKGDKTHVALIEGEGDKQTYKLNDKEVMEDTFKREVYQRIIGLLADDFAVNPAYGDAEYTVTYYMNDGSVKKNEYCAYDERSYAAFDKDGRCEFIIRRKKLDEMFASLENVDAGKIKE